MILRRVIEHVKAQNWFAVFLDFLIVVVGVFLGLQVNDWNEQRKVRAGETVWLTKLRTDISADIVSAHDKLQYMNDTGAAGRRALAFLDAGKPCETDCWRTLVDFFAASQWRDLQSSRVSPADLRTSPYPYDEALKRRLVDHYAFVEQLANVIAPPEYRILARELIPISVQEPMWRTCHEGGGEHQRIIFDCPEAAAPSVAREVLETLRTAPETRPTLNYYAVMIAAVAATWANETAEAEKILADIDARLAKRQ